MTCIVQACRNITETDGTELVNIYLVFFNLNCFYTRYLDIFLLALIYQFTTFLRQNLSRNLPGHKTCNSLKALKSSIWEKISIHESFLPSVHLLQGNAMSRVDRTWEEIKRNCANLTVQFIRISNSYKCRIMMTFFLFLMNTKWSCLLQYTNTFLSHFLHDQENLIEPFHASNT